MTKKNKRLFSALLCLLLTLSSFLTACGGSGQEAADPGASAEAAKNWPIPWC